MIKQSDLDKMLKTPEGEDKDQKIARLEKALNLVNYQLQTVNDTLNSGIRSYNLKEYRNTYVINAQDSLDDSYPFYVDFNIISEMTKIVSVELNFRIMNFRAYSTGAASGGGDTSGSGGGDTKTSSSSSTHTHDVTLSNHSHSMSGTHDQTSETDGHTHGYTVTTGTTGSGGGTTETSTAGGSHSHTVTIDDHTHTTPDHTHDVSYGIHEEDNSPEISFYVSENDGVTYSDKYGGFDTSQTAIDITGNITKAGAKLIKFESTARARLSVQVIVKLDIKAR